MQKYLIKTFFVIMMVVLWHSVQTIVEHFKQQDGSITLDHVHHWLESVNTYLNQHELLANMVLILTSAHIDIIYIGMAIWAIVGNSLRPFLGVFLIIVFRQISQILVSEPIPVNMIWHYPGFPSIIVTYYTTLDFFFSGHTASATYGLLEFLNTPQIKRIFVYLAFLFLLVEIFFILAMRFHYTADVITGIFAAFTAFYIAEKIAPSVDKVFNRYTT